MPGGWPTLTLLTRMVARDLERLHLGLGLLEPESHAHFIKEAHRRGEMLRRPPITRSPVERAKAEAAVSDERPHAELQGQSRGSHIVGFGRYHVEAFAI